MWFKFRIQSQGLIPRSAQLVTPDCIGFLPPRERSSCSIGSSSSLSQAALHRWRSGEQVLWGNSETDRREEEEERPVGRDEGGRERRTCGHHRPVAVALHLETLMGVAQAFIASSEGRGEGGEREVGDGRHTP